MECSSRAELNEHRYYVLNPTGRLNIRGHPIVPLYVVQLYDRTRLGPGCSAKYSTTRRGRVHRPASSWSACAYISYKSIFDFWAYYILVPDILGK